MADTPHKQLRNLVSIGKLASEPGDSNEIQNLLVSGTERLKDAHNQSLAFSSRFDLAYNAAHAFSLAALRWHGYRSDNRYLVFQTLPHTIGASASIWKVLAKAHEVRNAAEYLGQFKADATLLESLLKAVESVREAVSALPPLPGTK